MEQMNGMPNLGQMEALAKLMAKYSGKVMELVKVVKAGNVDYADFGRKSADLLNELLNISVRDLI